MKVQDDQARPDPSERRGWVRLWRKGIDSQVFRNDGLWKVWTWCLMKANHRDGWVSIKTGKGTSEVFVKRGQFVFGRKSAARELNMKERTVHKRMLKLKTMGNLDIQGDSHYSTVTILNYNHYQGDDNDERDRQGTGNNGIFSKIPQKRDRQSCVNGDIQNDEIGIENSSSYKGDSKKGDRQNSNERDKQGTGNVKNGDTNNKVLKNGNKEYCVEGDEPLRLASLLLTEIQGNKKTRDLSPFKRPALQAWARDIDLMIRRDGRTPERIREVIVWCQRDDFWWKNILSTQRLMKQFDRLEAEMVTKSAGRHDIEDDPYKGVPIIGGGGVRQIHGV